MPLRLPALAFFMSLLSTAPIQAVAESGDASSTAGTQREQGGGVEQILAESFNHRLGDLYLTVDISSQQLTLWHDGRLQRHYPVSTSKYGIGSQQGSNRTPLGVHRVSERFGDDAPLGMIFKGRVSTGRLAEIITTPKDVPEDHVTTRILWLDGQEPGLNRGGQVDSRRRYIYIHGTPEEGLIGTPASHGCVRMHNRDVVELFAQVPVGTLVVIRE